MKRIAKPFYLCSDCGYSSQHKVCDVCGCSGCEYWHSENELARWRELQNLERAGEISDLQRQVRFPLHSFHGPVLIRSPRYKNGRLAVYTADFVYKDIQGVRIVEDYKGYWTDKAKLTIAVFEAQEGTLVKLTGPQKMRKRRRAA